jgi:hypothetical protein
MVFLLGARRMVVSRECLRPAARAGSSAGDEPDLTGSGAATGARRAHPAQMTCAGRLPDDPRGMRPMRRWFAVVASMGLLTVVVACGSDAPVCDSAAAVRTSVDQVRNANVSENGLSQLRTDLGGLRTNLQQLYADAQAQFASEVSAVRASADKFAASLSTARAAPDVRNLAAVRSAIGGLRTSVQTLSDAMASTC